MPEQTIRILEAEPDIARAMFAYPIAFFGWGCKYPKQAQIIREYLANPPKVTVVSGWKRTAKCVSKDTIVSGQRIDSFGFMKGVARLYRVGSSLRATGQHVLMTPSAPGWISVSDAQLRGTPLFFECPSVSSGGIYLSEFLSGDLRLWKTVSNFQSDYLSHFHSHGGQPQTEVIYGRDGLPLPNDALSLVFEARHAQECSRVHRLCGHPSTSGDLHPLHHLFWVEDSENAPSGVSSSPQVRAYELSALSEGLRARVLSGVDRSKLASSLVYLILWPESRVFTIAVAVNTEISESEVEEYWDCSIPSIHAYSAGGFINHNTSSMAFVGSAWMLGELNHQWPGAATMGIKESYSWKGRFKGERRMLIGGSTLDHVDSVLLREYRNLIPPVAIKEWFSRQRPRIKLIDGTIAVCRSYDQHIDTWKSGAYELIHLDEEPPYEVFMECLERSRTTKGRILITVALDDADVSWLPEACENPMKVIGTDSLRHYTLGVEDVPNEIYPEEEKKIIFRQYDDTDLKDAVRKGTWPHCSGKWWHHFDKEIHVIPDFPIPRTWKKWRSVDAGMAAPTACAWMALHPRHNILFVYREYYKKGTLIDERCKDIIELSGNQRERDGEFWTERFRTEEHEMTLLDHAEFKEDPNTGDTLDYHYVRAGLVVQPWTTLGQQARRDEVNRWLWCDKRENHFITHQPGAPRLYIFESCVNLAWEAGKKSFKREKTMQSSVSEKKVLNRDDHLMDCVEGLCCELSWIIADRTIVE